jgi:hypothetical protein
LSNFNCTIPRRELRVTFFFKDQLQAVVRVLTLKIATLVKDVEAIEDIDQ